MKQTHIPYGAVSAIVMVIIGLVLYIAGWAFKPGMQYVTNIPFLIGVILNAQAFSKANEGDVSFGQIWSSGFKASAIVAIISLAWLLIANFIFPEMKEKGLEIARQSMQAKGMADDKIDQALDYTKKYYTLFMTAGVVFGTMIYGAIFALIGAATAKRKKATTA